MIIKAVGDVPTALLSNRLSESGGFLEMILDERLGNLNGIQSCALRRLSETHQKTRPFLTVGSFRTRLI